MSEYKQIMETLRVVNEQKTSDAMMGGIIIALLNGRMNLTLDATRRILFKIMEEVKEQEQS